MAIRALAEEPGVELKHLLRMRESLRFVKENSLLGSLVVAIGAENSTLAKTTTMSSLRHTQLEAARDSEVAPLTEANSLQCVQETISILISAPHPRMNLVILITLIGMSLVTTSSLQ